MEIIHQIHKLETYYGHRVEDPSPVAYRLTEGLAALLIEALERRLPGTRFESKAIVVKSSEEVRRLLALPVVFEQPEPIQGPVGIRGRTRDLAQKYYEEWNRDNKTRSEYGLRLLSRFLTEWLEEYPTALEKELLDRFLSKTTAYYTDLFHDLMRLGLPEKTKQGQVYWWNYWQVKDNNCGSNMFTKAEYAKDYARDSGPVYKVEADYLFPADVNW